MPHAVFFLSATLLATAAGHMSAEDGFTAPVAPAQTAPHILHMPQAQPASESEILRPAAPQRWVF